MQVLAINPFHGGSHRQFIESILRHSRHRWIIVPGPAVHWKWRMRSAPLQLAEASAQAIEQHGYPDVVFCTDMLDLPQWRGILRDERILRTPTAIYFHENQWSYPIAPGAREDFHYGYTNLLSALAADACLFNSAFHRDDFIQCSEQFVSRMPDAVDVHDFDRLARLSRVLPPGFDPPDGPEPDATPPPNQDTVRLGWVSRWEHDKRPDRLLRLCRLLSQQGVKFELILLGPRPGKPPSALQQLRDEFSARIRYDQYAPTRQEYWLQLSQIDVVFSAADHEFFGIAICEAIWQGSTPLLPDRLSYQELVDKDYRYSSLNEAAQMIHRWQSSADFRAGDRSLKATVEKYLATETIDRLDTALEEVIAV